VTKVSGNTHLFFVINYGKATSDAAASDLNIHLASAGNKLEKNISPTFSSETNIANWSPAHWSMCSGPKSLVHNWASHDALLLEETANKNTLLGEDVPDELAEENREDQAYRNIFRNRNHLAELARRCRLFAQRKLMRIVHKNGECNMSNIHVEKRRSRYLLDIFTTFIELKWKYTILVCILAYLFSWIAFALVWWLMHYSSIVNNGQPCVAGVHDFKTALLFSIETQQTVGYGGRTITENCEAAIFTLMLQLLVGAVMQSVVTGLIFAKLSRPNRRAETVIFSKYAVIYEESGCLCLAFRIGDMRRSQLIGVDINVILVKACENGVIYQQLLKVTTESCDEYFFLAWPMKIIHHIDENSPLWKISPEELLAADFEIIVILEASCEATGFTTQVRTSYLPGEILWGHTLAPVTLTYHSSEGHYTVDYSQFNHVIPTDTPEMSAEKIWIKKYTNIA